MALIQYVIVGHAAAGGGIVTRMLRGHPGVVACGPLFGSGAGAELDVPLPALAEDSVLADRRWSDPVDFLRELEQRLPEAVVGFELPDIHAVRGADVVEFLAVERRPRVIEVTRQNLLCRFAASQGARAAAPIELEFAACVHDFLWTRSCRQRIADALAALPTLSLTFEALLSDSETCALAVQEHLDLAPHSLPLPTEATDDPASAMVTNSAALRRRFEDWLTQLER